MQVGARQGIGRILVYTFLGLFTAITLLPFYVMVLGAFKTQSEITNQPYSFPGDVELSENLRWIFVRDETTVTEEAFASEFGLELPIGANRKVAELASSDQQLQAMFEYIGARIRFGNIVMAVRRGNLFRNLAATFIVSGTFVYNDFLTPLLFMTNTDFTHIQVALSRFVGAQTWFFGPIFAGVTIASIPMVLIYLLMNKYFVTGVTAGSVKG